MIKSLLIILSIFQSSLALASQQAEDIVDPPSATALNMMVNTLSSLKELKKQGKATQKNVEALVRLKLLPNLAMGVATKIALSKHWKDLNIKQKKMFQRYISESLINDYVGILSAYKNLDMVEITANPNVKRKDNKAIVKLTISLNQDSKPFNLTLKMIHLGSWHVYDIVFSGVSIVRNYRAQFDSHIRRKGMESLIEKSSEKLQKIAN